MYFPVVKSISSYFSTLSVAHNFFLSFLNILWYSYFLHLWAWCIRGFLQSAHLHNPNHILIFVLFSIWVFSYKIRIIYFLLLKIFSSIKFRFFSWIVVRYRTDISHHSSVYLTWSSCLYHFVLYFDLKFFLDCIHNDTDFQIDTVYMILDRVNIYIYLFLFSTRSILLFSFHIICS